MSSHRLHVPAAAFIAGVCVAAVRLTTLYRDPAPFAEQARQAMAERKKARS